MNTMPDDKPPKAELQKAKRAMPPPLVSSMLDDIAKIDPRRAQQTGTLGKVGRMTAHMVDPTTLAIHHGITKGIDLSQGGTNHSHGDLVPKGQIYVAHGGDPRELPDKLLGRSVEAYLIDHGWKPDAAARIARHLQSPPTGQRPGAAQDPAVAMPPQAAQSQAAQPAGGMPGLPPWMTGPMAQARRPRRREVKMPQITSSDLVARYGNNVSIWADINGDGNGTTIANQTADAIAYADARVDDLLRGTALNFKVPVTDVNGAVPYSIKDAKRMLAGYKLSTAHDVRDFDKEGNPITTLYADYLDAMRICEDIRSKKLILLCKY